MGAWFRIYIISLYQVIPKTVYLSLLFVFIIGLVCFAVCKGIRNGIRFSLGLLLVEYAILLFCSTVFFRDASDELTGYNLIPLWSYEAIIQGREKLIAENVMNTLVFVPVGLLVGAAFRAMTWKKVLMIGLCLSVGIEVLQFVMRRGFSEVDDVMHNTLGCVIGYGIYQIYKRLGKPHLFRFLETLWGQAAKPSALR